MRRQYARRRQDFDEPVIDRLRFIEIGNDHGVGALERAELSHHRQIQDVLANLGAGDHALQHDIMLARRQDGDLGQLAGPGKGQMTPTAGDAMFVNLAILIARAAEECERIGEIFGRQARFFRETLRR